MAEMCATHCQMCSKKILNRNIRHKFIKIFFGAAIFTISEVIDG